MSTLKQQILDAVDVQLEPIEIPEWACTATLRSFTGIERQRVVSKTQEKDRKAQEVVALLVVLGLGDESGKRIFDDKDVPAIMQKSAAVVERLGIAIAKHNGLHTEANEDAKKSLPTTPA
jgi:hypothetical protein